MNIFQKLFGGKSSDSVQEPVAPTVTEETVADVEASPAPATEEKPAEDLPSMGEETGGDTPKWSSEKEQ